MSIITPIAMLIHILMTMSIMMITTLIMTVSILIVTNITITVMSTTIQELKVKATIFILEKGRLTLMSRV
ncbi:hypothetical protein AltI4_15800 [Alteromonas sp. I4]|nr:hypothetical protein AltI4_15800 [Alteromonas sp. I4]